MKPRSLRIEFFIPNLYFNIFYDEVVEEPEEEKEEENKVEGEDEKKRVVQKRVKSRMFLMMKVYNLYKMKIYTSQSKKSLVAKS